MQTIMIHSDDSISTRMFAQWVCERYSFSLDKVTKIQEETITHFCNQKSFEPTLNLRGSSFKNILVYNNDVLIVFTQRIIESDLEKVDSFFELFAKDVETFKSYYEQIVDYDETIKANNIQVEYSSFSIVSYGGVQENCEYFKKEIFDNVKGDVYEPYLDIDLLFEEFLNSKSPILQFTGKPGLGKSKLITLFIKHLLARPEYLHDQSILKIARPTESKVLAEDDFWVSLRQGNFKALILDDIDYILQQRNDVIDSSEDKLHNDIANKMLTFTDGLLHQKTKILITTNVSYKKIDKALSRDFRLFDSIELRALKQEEALNVWLNRFKLKKVTFDYAFKGKKEITPAQLASEAEKLLYSEQQANKAKKSYCKEEGVSKLKDIRQNLERNVGFI